LAPQQCFLYKELYTGIALPKDEVALSKERTILKRSSYQSF